MTSTTRPPGDEAALGGYAHGRVPREVRRRHVLALAEALFIERGYQQASMDELARRAGVSKPVVYDLVGSKEELFGSCMAASSQDLAERIGTAVAGAAEGDLEAQLRAGALAFFDFVGERRDAWAALLSGAGAPVTAAVATIRQHQAGQVVGLLTAGAADAGVDVDPVGVEGLAHALNGAFESLAAWWPDHPELDAGQLADLVTDMVWPGLARLVADDAGS